MLQPTCVTLNLEIVKSHHLLCPKLAALGWLRDTLLPNILLSTRFASRNLSLRDRPCALSYTSSLRWRLRSWSAPLLPVIPAALVLAYICVSRLPCNARSGFTPDACFAEEDHLLAGGRFREPKLVLEFVRGKEQRIWVARDGQIDSGGDRVVTELVRLTDIDQETRV